MLDGQRFPFTERTDSLGRASVMPYLPLTLTNGSFSVEVMALLESGNLADSEARGLVLSAIIAEFSPVLLAFAWTQAQDVPVILGQMNFFAEFNVCFYRHELAFEVCPRAK